MISNSALVFGTIVIIGPIGSLILSPLIATLVDKNSKRKVMLLVQGISLMFLFFSNLFPEVNTNLYFNYFLVVVIRVASEVLIINLRAAIPEIANQKYYQQFNAAEQTTAAMANIIGASIGGILFALIKFSDIMWISIALLRLSLIVTITMVFKKRAGITSKTKDGSSNFRSAIKFVLKSANIRDIICLAAVTNFFAALISIGLPYVLVTSHHINSMVFSIVDGLSSVEMVLTGGLLLVIQIKSSLEFIYKIMSNFYLIFLVVYLSSSY